MKTSITFIAIAFFLLSCGTGKNLQKSHPHVRYFPKELSDLYFGMPLVKALEARQGKPEQIDDQEMDFRQVYLEQIGRDGIEFTVFYFDNERDLPLYEMIIQYESEALRDQSASRLLGPPNFEDGTEWLFNTGEGFQVQAWTFQSKLVIVGKLPGTEWNE